MLHETVWFNSVFSEQVEAELDLKFDVHSRTANVWTSCDFIYCMCTWYNIVVYICICNTFFPCIFWNI